MTAFTNFEEDDIVQESHDSVELREIYRSYYKTRS